jgi:hypothetical protein
VIGNSRIAGDLESDNVSVLLLESRGILHTVAALNFELQCNIHCLLSLSLRFWRVKYMAVMN